MEQESPVHPGPQRHWKPSLVSTQEPPFRQGLD